MTTDSIGRDVDAAPPVLVVPGYTGSGPGHWQTLWERADPRLRRVEQASWDHPDRDAWVRRLEEAIASLRSAPVLVAHSLGCIAVAHWAAMSCRRVAGALLVAPADVERPDAPEAIRGFAPVPLERLPFRSIVVAGDDDPYADADRSDLFARCWGSTLVRLRGAGHINTDAGFGPWPEGMALLRGLCDGSGA